MSLKLKQKPKQSSWTLAADDDELLDDEDLLTEEDKQRPVISGEAFDEDEILRPCTFSSIRDVCHTNFMFLSVTWQ